MITDAARSATESLATIDVALLTSAAVTLTPGCGALLVVAVGEPEEWLTVVGELARVVADVVCTVLRRPVDVVGVVGLDVPDADVSSDACGALVVEPGSVVDTDEAVVWIVAVVVRSDPDEEQPASRLVATARTATTTTALRCERSRAAAFIDTPPDTGCGWMSRPAGRARSPPTDN
jgi:hypothetical protein